MADHYRVPTGSMIPTIEIGDHVFVNKMAYDLKLPFTNISLKEMNQPSRGDIVIFEYPHNPSINYVKRLIALPGDHVLIQNGFVKVNGQISLQYPEELGGLYEKLFNGLNDFKYYESLGDKSYLVQRSPLNSRDHSLSFIVPSGQFFMMGDNRDNSSDSRSWGFVPRENFMGKINGVTVSVAFNGWIPQIQFHRFGKKLM